MRVEFSPPESVIEPRHWVRHDQAFAMMMGRGSIEWGARRSTMEKFDYAAGDLALCDRHVGEWVGIMATPHLQLGISDAPLMAASDGAYGEVELRPPRKFADLRLGALVVAAHAEMAAGFPSGRLFLDSIEQAMAVALVNGHAARHRPVQMHKGGLGSARLRRIKELVHAKIEDDLSLDEMALSVGLSTAHFARMFRKSTGETPHQFVLRQRIEHAKAMLRDPDARVLDAFGAHGLAPSAIQEVVAEIRSLTSKPFAMNLWVSMEDEGAETSDAEAFERARSHLAPHLEALGASKPQFSPYKPIRFEDQVRVLLDAKVPAFSFIYGIPPKEILEECHRQGILTIGTATTRDEAIALEDDGVDVVVASGSEAGGHRGSFLRSSEDSLTGTISLVPQIVDAVELPVVAAGGIADARGIAAAFALGAEGVQMGTVFLACEESGASSLHREAILSGKASRTSLTRGFTGRLARGIHNQLLEEMNRPGVAVLPYPLQRALMRNLAVPAQQGGRRELLALWAGQSAGIARYPDVAKLLQSLVNEVSEKLA